MGIGGEELCMPVLRSSRWICIASTALRKSREMRCLCFVVFALLVWPLVGARTEETASQPWLTPVYVALSKVAQEARVRQKLTVVPMMYKKDDGLLKWLKSM